jgi:DMSO/TMAO reductase YedYZ molybdopterin-dependent catalytic subunit
VDHDRHQPDRWVGAVAGTVAGGSALAAGELAAALYPPLPGPVSAVAAAVRDAVPGWFARWGIDAFGSLNKPLLVAGVGVVSLVLAAGLGVASRRQPLVGVAGLAVFGLVGTWAMVAEPAGSTSGAVTAGVTAVVAGSLVLVGLLVSARAAPSAPLMGAHGRPAQDPRVRRGDRRRFLISSGAISAGAAVAAWASIPGRDPVGAELARREVLLPRPPDLASVGRRVETALAHPVAATSQLSPLVTPNDAFYRIDTALFVPQVDPGRWRLSITGLVDREVSWGYDELVARSTTVAPVTLACVSNEVGGDLVGTAVWQGVPLAELLAEAGVRPEAGQVVGRSVDGWTAGFPTAVVGDGRTALVAVAMNGEPLPVQHGFPARLVVAGLYGYVSATKWLERIELHTWDDFDGYWVPRGWAKEGPMKTQSRIDTPRRGRPVPVGPVAIAGVAWAPNRGIRRVEVQVDDAAWDDAALGAVLGDETWVQWRLRWDATPGRHRLRVRATDATGETQTEQRRPVAPDGATGWHTVEVEVA